MKASEPGLPPRLGEAARLLPLISGHLDAAASQNPHSALLQLVPVIEEGKMTKALPGKVLTR